MVIIQSFNSKKLFVVWCCKKICVHEMQVVNDMSNHQPISVVNIL